MADRENLHSIRIQTARMLEIYALLQAEMNQSDLELSPQDLSRLQSAIRTIASNMSRLQTHCEETTPDEAKQDMQEASSKELQAPEESSHAPLSGLSGSEAETRELGEIVDAVLKWQAEERE